MTHVVERCPSCGVEHDRSHSVGCEACGTALRPWCRRHSREAGWLDGPACPRCAEEAVRTAAMPRGRAVAAAAPFAAAGPDGAKPTAWPGRSPREILRGGSSREAPAKPSTPESQQGIPYAIGEVLGTGIIGWMAGAVLGLVGGAVTGQNIVLAARLGGQLFGLGGLVVGIIYVIAKRARRRRE
jgi:hypothetical protein